MNLTLCCLMLQTVGVLEDSQRLFANYIDFAFFNEASNQGSGKNNKYEFGTNVRVETALLCGYFCLHEANRIALPFGKSIVRALRGKNRTSTYKLGGK